MWKNDNSMSDIFVRKICEKMWKILTKEDIVDIWLRSWGSKSRVAYAMSILLGRGLVVKVTNGIYRILGDAKSGDTLGSLDSYYWEIVRKLISIHAPSGALLWWEKALELHLMDFSIPDVLILYTRNTNLRLTLSDGRSLHFRTLVSWAKTGKKNLFSFLNEKKVHLGEIANLSVLSQETAILEALTVKRHDEWVNEYNVLRFLKRYGQGLDVTTLAKLVWLRYIRPMNRLRSIAKSHGYIELYETCIAIIKKEWGGCFITF